MSFVNCKAPFGTWEVLTREKKNTKGSFGTRKVLGKKKENDFLMFGFTVENIKENKI